MNQEQESIKKTVAIFEDAINAMNYDADNTELLGAMLKGFRLGYKAAIQLKNLIKEREYEDIPF